MDALIFWGIVVVCIICALVKANSKENEKIADKQLLERNPEAWERNQRVQFLKQQAEEHMREERRLRAARFGAKGGFALLKYLLSKR